MASGVRVVRIASSGSDSNIGEYSPRPATIGSDNSWQSFDDEFLSPGQEPIASPDVHGATAGGSWSDDDQIRPTDWDTDSDDDSFMPPTSLASITSSSISSLSRLSSSEDNDEFGFTHDNSADDEDEDDDYE